MNLRHADKWNSFFFHRSYSQSKLTRQVLLTITACVNSLPKVRIPFSGRRWHWVIIIRTKKKNVHKISISDVWRLHKHRPHCLWFVVWMRTMFANSSLLVEFLWIFSMKFKFGMWKNIFIRQSRPRASSVSWCVFVQDTCRRICFFCGALLFSVSRALLMFGQRWDLATLTEMSFDFFYFVSPAEMKIGFI